MAHELNLPWRKGYWRMPGVTNHPSDVTWQQLVDADGRETLCILDQGSPESSHERHAIIDAMLEKLNAGTEQQMPLLKDEEA